MLRDCLSFVHTRRSTPHRFPCEFAIDLCAELAADESSTFAV